MLCCASGQVRLLDHVRALEQRDKVYESLKLKEGSDDQKHFRKYLHLYNNEVAFGSMTMGLPHDPTGKNPANTLAVRTAVYGIFISGGLFYLRNLGPISWYSNCKDKWSNQIQHL